MFLKRTSPEIVSKVLDAKSKTKIEHLLATFDSLALPLEAAEAMRFQVEMYKFDRYRRQAVWNWANRHKTHQRTIRRKYSEFVFQKEQLLPDVAVISPPEPEGVALALTTNAGNMMTTLPQFLTSLAPANLSIVLVHNRGGYTHGIPGISKDPWEGIEGLHTLLEENNLLPDLIIGASVGCLFGVAYACVFHSTELMLFGPSDPNQSPTWNRLADTGNLVQNVPVNGISWVGGNSENDLYSAEALREKFPGVEVEVVANAGHNSIGPLISRGRFELVLEHHLSRIRDRSEKN